MLDNEKKNQAAQEAASNQNQDGEVKQNDQQTQETKKAPVSETDTMLEMSDAEVAEKSVEELDKLIQKASQKPGTRKDNAGELPPQPEVKKQADASKQGEKSEKPSVKLKSPDGEDREIKSLEEAQKFNGRLTNEMGSLRKENEMLNTRLKALEAQITVKNESTPEAQELQKKKQRELQDKVLTDPKSVITEITKEIIEGTEAEKAQREQKQQQQRLENVKFIKERHPEILDEKKGVEIANSVTEFLAADGYTPEEINYIRRDPFGSLPPELLNLYITIGKMRVAMKTLEGKATQTQNQDQDLITKINAAANSASIITKNGQGVPGVKSEILDDVSVNAMSTDEIDKKIKEYSKG